MMRAFVTSILLALLVSASFAAGDTRLVNAVKMGDSATAAALLAKKADPNAAEPDGTTPLHWAIVVVCALAYKNRVPLLAKMLGQSETRINRQLKRKPR